MPHRDLRFSHDYMEDAPPIVPVQGAVSGKAGGPVTDHSHTASGDGGTFDAANLRSHEDAENGAVLTADGAEGSEWRLLELDSLADVNAPDPDDGDTIAWDDSAGEWVASPPAGGTPDAADVTYTPGTAADWDGSADPGDADAALDQLAERVKDIELAGGGGSPDASAVTYTPTTATDWDSDADPGNVDDALDQLAERVDDLEGAGGGGAPTIGTAYASAQDAHTTDATWEDINSMSVSLTPAAANAKLLCTFTCSMKCDSTQWDHTWLKFVLDGGTSGETYTAALNSNAVASRYWIFTVHTVFEGVSAAAHTVKVQWQSAAGLNVSFYERRLTVMVCQ